ncbi:MAG TPA: CehA/McbA family metallohydrolase [Solirubrobacterales bacterium]|nr:CehA/McbA family metallohydrolase [Solirubrobacterales bacterium]
MPKITLSLVTAIVAGFFLLPSLASAACTLPASPVRPDNTHLNDFVDPADSIVKSGTFGPELNGKFIQIPFDIEPGMTGLRIRYCYENAGPDGQTGGPGGIYDADNATIDLGVYDPNPTEPGKFTAAQSRGWSGSSVRMIGISENGFTGPSEYEANRRAYVPGFTNRGYKPGPIQAGRWAVELGAGRIHPDDDGVEWKVEVTPSSDPEWSDNQFVPDPFTPNVGNPNAGWYTGDLHVHGEQEPGNALVSDTLDLAFGDSPAGSGLDFLTLVDHNNNMARKVIGSLQAEHPDKVVIPGTEMTTYDGHFNAQGNDPLVDFRLGEILKPTDPADVDVQAGDLSTVRGIENPSSRFAAIQAGGGWAQINHPTIFKDSPAACRGCFWNYDDTRTDFSKVNAIEIQTGRAGIPANSETPGMNPFTQPAIDYYEHALSTGAHIAAVGSSDDHDAGQANGYFDSSVGHGATVVHADQLSQSAIIAAVKAGHTYVKPFGPDAPDVELTATGDNATAIPGDSITAETLGISVKVTGADSGVRPGPYTLAILRDGVQVDSAPVSGASFTHTFNTAETGRYSFKLTRVQGSNTMIEAYSTPVWFTKKDVVIPPVEPSNRFSFAGTKLNKKKGTALLKVKVAGAGVVKLSGRNVAGATAKPKKANQIVSLTVKATGKLKKTLRKTGKATAKTKVTFTPTGGKTATKSKPVKLVLKKKSKR